VWLSQPNLEASGLSQFGSNWRGLEAPRHLCLYTRKSLTYLLREVGFCNIEMLPAEEAAEFYFRQSLAMKNGLNPQQTPNPPGWKPQFKQQARAANKAARSMPERGESLTLVATKPY